MKLKHFYSFFFTHAISIFHFGKYLHYCWGGHSLVNSICTVSNTIFRACLASRKRFLRGCQRGFLHLISLDEIILYSLIKVNAELLLLFLRGKYKIMLNYTSVFTQ